MSKHVRKILPLLLCLLLMACLLPAAYADGVEVSTLAELQNALNSSQSCVSTGQIGGPGSGIELTVPTGVTLNITSGFVCVSSMTVNGTVNVGDNGMLMVDQSLTGSGAVNVASGCKTFNLPAACYDSETHALVSLIHNSSDNVTLVHTPANQAELRSALLKAEDAADYGIDSGILIAQNLTISQSEEVNLGNMRLSVQYGATLTLDDGAVVVTKQDVMVEQSSIHVRGGAVLAASVQLNASTIDFSNGGGFFGKRFKVRNTEDPAACIRGLDLTRAKRIDEESQTIFEFQLNEPIYGGDPTVDSELALRNAISAFNQLREQDPSARIDVYTSGDFTITGNITIPDGFQLRCRNNLTIAADAVVTVDGKLDAIEGGHVSILGTVINNNQFRMFDTGVMELSGTLVNNHDVCYKRVSTDRTHLVINSGATFTNNSNFAIADDLMRDPAVLGVDVDGYCVARMWDEPDMSRYFAPEVFDHFEGMCSSGKFVYLELHGIEEVSIAESMNIPENMSVKMGSTRLVASNGKTLHVRGELSIKDLVVENGGGLLLHGNGTVAVAGELNNSSAVVVMDNSVLNVSGEMVNRDALRVEGNSSVTVSGKLTNNATIGIGENAQIAVSGEFVNNRLINLRNWNGTRPLITIGAQGKYEEHGGFDVLTQFDYESAISAIDLSDYCRLVYVTSDNNRVTRLFPGRDLSFDPNGFKQMCQNGDTVYLEIRGRETFQMDSDVTIPNVMEVVANDVDLVIPAGVNVKLKGHMILRNGAALDLKGKLSEGTLGLDEGTTVKLTGSSRLEPDKLRLDGTISVEGGRMSDPKLLALNNGRPNGHITLADGCRSAVTSEGLDEAKLFDWVNFNGEKAYFEIYYYAQNDADFYSMMGKIQNLPKPFYGIEKVEYQAVIRDNVNFPGAQIKVAGYNGASLTIAEGATLTAPTIQLQGAQMTVNGTFISVPRDTPWDNHNGALMVIAENGVDSMLTVTDTGIIGGTDCSIELPQGTTDPTRYIRGINPGQLKVVPDPYRPLKIYAVAPELHLPESLNVIESEAFAGGSFSSVYIPASVSSIASDAFGDMTGLKVYGEYGTEAAQFASDHHFPFAPLAWRGNQ